MIDISAKPTTLRIAQAQAVVQLNPSTIDRVRQGDIPKGDPIAVARIAAVQAAKNTSSIIPFCHPLPIDFVGVEFDYSANRITINVTVKAISKTGVEMEALTAAGVAGLTIYDMVKMIDSSALIQEMRLIEKRGGKSDYIEKFETKLRAAVLVLSDSIASGKKGDYSGKLIEQRLTDEGFDVVDYIVLPDDIMSIQEKLRYYADIMKVDLVLTTGGTGFSRRDFTPEATAGVLEREVPGIVEMLRSSGQQRTPYSMLSRGKSGIRGDTLIINLPGSRNGVAESLDALFPVLLHSFKVLSGKRHKMEGYIAI
jgi:cyclic pyranopterin monophosphate synthase